MSIYIPHTDLALEAHQLWKEQAHQTTQLSGVKAWEDTCQGFPLEQVDILDQEGAQALQKPVGSYLTLTMDPLLHRETQSFARGARAIAHLLTQLMQPIPSQGLVLVVGLGNRAITPDAIGPRVHDQILITRHLLSQAPQSFSGFRSVASLSTGVLGTTGMESGEMIHALCQQLQPACLLAVDALASRSVQRLCRTIQLSNTGISPGSGVGNHRSPLTAHTLGIPVLTLGVPTVVEGGTLAADLTGTPPSDHTFSSLLVTPKDIDSQVEDLSKVMAYGINLALQPQLQLEELELLLS